MFGLLGRLPARLGDPLGAAIGRLAYRIGWRRDVVERQLAAAFPDRDRAWLDRVALGCFEHVGREAVAVAGLTRGGLPAVRRAVERFEGQAAIRAALDEGRGVVIVTGHFGNWEVGGYCLAAHGMPVDGVVQRIKNPYLNRHVEGVRRRLGIRLIHRASAWDRLRQSLGGGRLVAFAADQDARERGVFVPFFGRAASTHRAPALLALRADAPFFVGGAHRVGRRLYHVWAVRLAAPEAGDVGARVQALTRAWAAELERRIRLSPDQYFWHHRRWKTRPPGEPTGPAQV